MNLFPVTKANSTYGVVAFIPWGILREHEPQAIKNHKQTLAQLAHRGGLSPVEIAAIIENRPWGPMSVAEAWKVIYQKVIDHTRMVDDYGFDESHWN